MSFPSLSRACSLSCCSRISRSMILSAYLSASGTSSLNTSLVGLTLRVTTTLAGWLEVVTFTGWLEVVMITLPGVEVFSHCWEVLPALVGGGTLRIGMASFSFSCFSCACFTAISCARLNSSSRSWARRISQSIALSLGGGSLETKMSSLELFRWMWLLLSGGEDSTFHVLLDFSTCVLLS